MKILVTGASGFVGYHLITELIKSDHQVLGIDSFSDYYSSEYKRQRQRSLRKKNGDYFDLEIDVADQEHLMNLIDREKPESIIHLAGQPGVRINKGDFSSYSHSNLEGFSSILSSAIKTETPNFLFASSSSVYGNSSEPNLREDQSDLKPISFYGATKLSNEILSQSVSRDSNINIRALRFFTVYGTWGRPDMAYFRIARALRKGTTFPLYGQSTVLRDFTHVSDTVSQIRLLVDELSTKQRNYFDIVNIGGGKPRSLDDMISILEKVSGKSLRAHSLPKINGDVLVTNSSSEYRESLVGPHTFLPLEVGLEDLYRWISLPEIETLLDKYNL